MLEIKQVNKFYKQYQACCDITMHFSEDKIVGLFGANGAGKSTCFHIMTAQHQTAARYYLETPTLPPIPSIKEQK